MLSGRRDNTGGTSSGLERQRYTTVSVRKGYMHGTLLQFLTRRSAFTPSHTDAWCAARKNSMCAALLASISGKGGQMWHLQMKVKRRSERGEGRKRRRDKRQRDSARKRMMDGVSEAGGKQQMTERGRN